MAEHVRDVDSPSDSLISPSHVGLSEGKTNKICIIFPDSVSITIHSIADTSCSEKYQYIQSAYHEYIPLAWCQKGLTVYAND